MNTVASSSETSNIANGAPPAEMIRYFVTDPTFMDSELPSTIHNFVNFQAPMTILDIEPHEGLSACLFSDMCLQHTDSKLVCVGKYPGTTESLDPEKACLRNLLRSRFPQKVQAYNMEHEDFFRENQFMYDIVYLRLTEDTETNRWLLDESYKVLKQNGMLWVYGYMSEGGQLDQKSKVVDVFIDDHRSQVTIIHRAKEIALLKGSSLLESTKDDGVPLSSDSSPSGEYTVGTHT